jgi:GDP/UDP-N,N'-diacetylbacillosamine 2-epimerase (hydrolysing)
VSKNPNSYAFPSLGQLKYLSCIAQVNGVVGNSSSGILEVPSFKKGTINIGDRQKGRIRTTSVIDCETNKKSISKAIETLLSEQFKNSLNSVKNPFDQGNSSAKIVELISGINLQQIVKKIFYDF